MALDKEYVVNKALQMAGNRNKYQYIILTVLCAVFYIDCFLLMGNSFYLMDPVFICAGSDEIVDEKVACDKIKECVISNDFTIVKELGLYCDRQGERDVIQSSLFIGSFFGLLFMNFLSDLRGRRMALMLDLLIGVLGVFFTVLGAYVKSTAALTVGSVFCGFSGYSIVIVCYIIAGDFCEQSFRQQGTLIMNVFYSAGLVSFFFFYYWCNQWYNILIIFMLIPIIGLTIVCYILVEQSPNYYLCKKNDQNACIDALTNVATYNGKSFDEIQGIRKFVTEGCEEIESRKSQADREFNTSPSLLQVLRQKKYLKIIICVALNLSGGNLFFYGIEYAIDDIGFNFGVDNLALGLIEIATTLVLTRFVYKMKRKRTLAIVYLMTIVISFIFIPKFVQSSKLICTILIVLIRILTTTGYYMVVMIQTESFPIQIQSIGAGSIEAFAQLGSFAAPLLVTFAVDNGLQKMATMGVVMLLCLIPLIFVPQPRRSVEDMDQKQLLQSLLEDSTEQPSSKPS